MKVLAVGLDTAILDPLSSTAKRAVSYGEKIAVYDVVVPAKKDTSIFLSPKILAQGICGTNKVVRWIRIYREIRTLNKKNRYDLITVQDLYFLAALAWLIRHRASQRLEIQVHGLEKDNLFRNFLAGFLLRRADQVRTVSQRLAAVLVKKYDVERKKIKIYPISADVKNFLSPVHVSNFSFPLRLLSIGRLVPVKNIDTQIRSLSILKEKKIPAFLKIIGVGPEQTALENLAKDIGVFEDVVFLKQCDSATIKKELLNTDIFIHSAWSEGWGLVLIEAAAAGVPIVTSDIGCVGELLSPLEEVTVADPHSAEDFAFKIILLKNNQTLAKKMAKQAQEKVRLLSNTTPETINLVVESWQNLVKV